MANEEHLKILRQGVEVWNQWRKDNPKIKPDFNRAILNETNLSGANFSGADCEGVNLYRADLSGANLTMAILSRANLREANLREANLKGAILNETILSKTNLMRTNLREANLSGASLKEAIFQGAILNRTNLSRMNLMRTNLNEANLIGTNLREANLSGASLREANLNKANLSNADLKESDLRKANLSEAIIDGAILDGVRLCGANLSRVSFRGLNLSEMNLSMTNFSETNLREANLSGANLNETNLTKADLGVVRLINAKLDGANLTGARLWEIQRAGWSIRGVICEYVYWDREAKVKTEYAPGEFERLFAEQTKICLFYKGGITPLEIATLPALIQRLSGIHQGCNLRFVSIHEDSGGAVVELAIEDTENFTSGQIKQLQASLELEAQRQVEYQQKILIERTMRLQLEKQLDSFVDKLILHQGSTYNISGKRNVVIGSDANDSKIITGHLTPDRSKPDFNTDNSRRINMDEYRELAQTVINFLTPAFPTLLLLGTEAGKEASKKIGADLWEGAKSIWRVLSPKIEAKPGAMDAVKELANSPEDEDNLDILRANLKKIFKEDDALATEVRQILDKAKETGVEIKVQGERNIIVGGDAIGGTYNTGDTFNNKDK